ncbi:MAG TPA: BON domain-containing protein [Syntrophorhabdaceae bacterium]|nr:BON domain-containing protein [Syntrophorhabdaceae bacterium]
MKSKIGFKVTIILTALLFLLIGCKPSTQQQGRVENRPGEEQRSAPGTAPGTPGLAANVDDAQITSQVQARLSSDDTLKASQINVETNNGVVRLTGNVPSTDAVDKAAQMAQSVNGVSSVQNDLTVG